MSLWSNFLSHNGRRVQKWAQYFPVYDRHLARFTGGSPTMLEIGVSKGGSLQMWKRYLGPHAQIVGVDIDPSCKAFEEDQIAVRIGDQSDLGFLQSLVDEFGAFDAVLDDGSHRASHMVGTFRCLYPQISPTGVYMVEDLHAAYVERYEGGYKRAGSFIEFCKDMIDDIHVRYSHKIPPLGYSPITLSMHVYDSIAVFERGRHSPARSYTVGENTIEVKKPEK